MPKLVFALSSACDWKKQHGGFHFPTFYNLIVDTFEDPEDEIAKRSTHELLQWWNWYVLVQSLVAGVLIFTAFQQYLPGNC